MGIFTNKQILSKSKLTLSSCCFKNCFKLIRFNQLNKIVKTLSCNQMSEWFIMIFGEYPPKPFLRVIFKLKFIGGKAYNNLISDQN